MSVPSSSWNYGGMGLKNPTVTSPVKPTIFLKFSEFESGQEPDEKEDEANIGGATTTIGYDRVKIESKPTFTDGLRWNEGFEYLMYGAIGGARTGTAVTGEDGMYDFVFQNGGSRETLPTFTLLKGINLWKQQEGSLIPVKPKILDNQKIGELELKFQAKDNKTTISPKFMGDAALFNVCEADPTRTYLATSHKVKSSDISFYIGDVGADEDDLAITSCVKEFTLKLDNDLKATECFEDEFGINSYDEGNFKAEVSGTLELNHYNMLQEAAWLTGTVDGVKPSTNVYYRQIMIKIEGLSYDIGTEETPNIVTPSMKINLPKVAIKTWTPSESGNDAGEVKMEGNIVPATSVSAPIIVNCKTNLSELAYATQTWTVPE